MAAIEHGTVEQMTLQQTLNTSYTDVPGATVDSSNFVAGGKYLLLVNAQVGGQSTGSLDGFQMVEGIFVITDSTHYLEPQGSTTGALHTYSFATVFVADGDEDVKMQFRSQGLSNAYVDSIVIFWMRLDALVEGTDYKFDDTYRFPALQHTTSFVDMSSITFTPENEDDDWLIIAHARYLVGSSSRQAEYRINRDSDTEIAPLSSEEGEDGNETRVVGLFRVFTLSAEEHTFAIQGRDDATGAHDNQWSQIFALRLNVFKDHSFFWNESPLTRATSYTEIANIDITPQVTADFLVIGFGVQDILGAFDWTNIRLQKGGTNLLTGIENAWECRAWDLTDENQFSQIAVTELTKDVAADLDFDAKSETADGAWEDRTMVAISMELAAAAVVTRRIFIT